METSIERPPCPCCSYAQFNQLLNFSAVPVSGIYRDSDTEVQPIANLAWEVCSNCGLMRNCNFLSPPDYVAKPRPTQRQMPSYLQTILDLISTSIDKEDLVIEIGANDGSFLDELRTAGYSNLRGVEPSAELASIARSKGHYIIQDYFTEAVVPDLIQTCGAPKLVICRHTLEHVPDPASFVAGIRSLITPVAGSALLEVPDSTAMWEGINFIELWDEHLFYFTPNSLRRLVKRFGLTELSGRVFPHLETRNLMMHIDTSIPEFENRLTDKRVSETQEWASFEANFKQMAKQLRQVVLAASKPIYLMGAAHPQANLVNFLDLGDHVDFMVDDDPEKSGKLPPILSTTVRTLSTSEFIKHPTGGTLVLSALGYPKWQDRLAAAAVDKGMIIIDPRRFATSE